MSQNHAPILPLGQEVAKLAWQLDLAGQPHAMANDAKGHIQLLKHLRGQPGAQVVCEATGGYEQPVVPAKNRIKMDPPEYSGGKWCGRGFDGTACFLYAFAAMPSPSDPSSENNEHKPVLAASANLPPQVAEARTHPRDPLHGITLEAVINQLVQRHGWAEMGHRIPIRCFQFNPTVKSSLIFLRKTPWARRKVENWYLAEL